MHSHVDLCTLDLSTHIVAFSSRRDMENSNNREIGNDFPENIISFQCHPPDGKEEIDSWLAGDMCRTLGEEHAVLILTTTLR